MTVPVGLMAILADLADMAAHRPPTLDLALIILVPTTQIVAAIPLEPAPRIIGVDPPLGPPD